MKRFPVIMMIVFSILSDLRASGGSMEFNAGGNKFIFRKNSILYYSGSYADVLWRGILTQDTDILIANYRMTLKKNTEAEFHLSGNFASGFPAQDTELLVNGKKLVFAKNKRIRLDESGHIISGYLAVNTVFEMENNRIILKKSVKEIEQAEFYPSGALKQGYLAEPTVCHAGNYSVKLFHRIGFYENGKLNWGSLQKDTMLKINTNNVNFAGGQYYQIAFYPGGSIQEGYLSGSNRFQIDGYAIDFQYRISFHKNGTPSRGSLASPFVFQNKKFSPPQTVSLTINPQGKLVGVKEFQYPSR